MLSHGPEVETRSQRFVARAQREPTATFDNLLSLLTVALLAECFHALRKDAAVGVDQAITQEPRMGFGRAG